MAGCSRVVRRTPAHGVRRAATRHTAQTERRAARILATLSPLAELQFDRGGAAEDRHGHLEARTILVDFLDNTVEGGERPVRDAHRLADLEGDGRLGALDALSHLALDAHGPRLR